MGHIRRKMPAEIEHQYRMDMQSIVQCFINYGKYPINKDRCMCVHHVVETLIAMNPEYVTAACNFMGYPASYEEVCEIMEHMIERYMGKPN